MTHRSGHGPPSLGNCRAVGFQKGVEDSDPASRLYTMGTQFPAPPFNSGNGEDGASWISSLRALGG